MTADVAHRESSNIKRYASANNIMVIQIQRKRETHGIIPNIKKKRNTIPINHNILFPLPRYPKKEIIN